MNDNIVIDLKGMNLTADELERLHEQLRQQVVEFLKTGTATPKSGVVALGPGWVGIET